DDLVTGVQTCALPICGTREKQVSRPRVVFAVGKEWKTGCTYGRADHSCQERKLENILRALKDLPATSKARYQVTAHHTFQGVPRSEERRVGKACRSR